LPVPLLHISLPDIGENDPLSSPREPGKSLSAFPGQTTANMNPFWIRSITTSVFIIRFTGYLSFHPRFVSGDETTGN